MVPIETSARVMTLVTKVVNFVSSLEREAARPRDEEGRPMA